MRSRYRSRSWATRLRLSGLQPLMRGWSTRLVRGKRVCVCVWAWLCSYRQSPDRSMRGRLLKVSWPNLVWLFCETLIFCFISISFVVGTVSKTGGLPKRSSPVEGKETWLDSGLLSASKRVRLFWRINQPEAIGWQQASSLDRGWQIKLMSDFYIPPFRTAATETRPLGTEEFRTELTHAGKPLVLAVCSQGLKLLNSGMELVLPFEYNLTFEILRSKVKFINDPLKKAKKDIGVPEGLVLSLEEVKAEFRGGEAVLTRVRDLLRQRINQVGFHDMIRPIKRLGKGNFGTVYLVERYEDGEIFAAKSFLKYNIYGNEKGKESLENEIFIMRMLNHPSLMRVFEVYQTQNSIYVIIEQLRGGSLGDRLSGFTTIKPAECKKVIHTLLLGLACLHQHRVMHRDLKPDNIMFRTEDFSQAVMADFGLATLCDIDQYLFTRCGTPGYVAPEVINLADTKCRYDPVCDIYSLGCIFYEMLTGRRLFEARNQNDLLRVNKAAFIDFKMSAFLEMDPDALSLLKRMLENDPKQRITAKEALAHKYFQKIQLLDVTKRDKGDSSGSQDADHYHIPVKAAKPAPEAKKVGFQGVQSKVLKDSKESIQSKDDKISDSIGVLVVRNPDRVKSKKIDQLLPARSFADRLLIEMRERRKHEEEQRSSDQGSKKGSDRGSEKGSDGRIQKTKETSKQSDKIQETEQPEPSPTYARRNDRRKKLVKVESPESDLMALKPVDCDPKEVKQEQRMHEVVLRLGSPHENLVVISEGEGPFEVVIRSKRAIKAYVL